MRNNWFEPDHKYAFLFGMSVFDEVWKLNKKDEYEQVYPNLDTIQRDCNFLLECLSKYGFTARNVYKLINNPSSRDVEHGMAHLAKMLRAGKKQTPLEKYLVIYLFAGHGIMCEG